MKSGVLPQVLAEVARRYGVTEGALLSPSREPRVAAGRKWVAKTLRDHGWSLAQIGRALNMSRQSAHEASRKAAPWEQERVEDRLEAAEASLRRYLGIELHAEISAKTGLSRSFALWFTILVEACPRTLSTDSWLSQYEHACELQRIEVGELNEVSVRQAVLRIRKQFDEVGLPDPIETIAAGGYRLSADIQGWTAANFGRPAHLVTKKASGGSPDSLLTAA